MPPGPTQPAAQPRGWKPPWWWWAIAVAAGLPLLWIGSLAAPVGVAVSAPATELPEAELRQLAHDPAVVARGRALWGNCIGCHGPAGEGTQGPNLRDDYWLHGSDMRDLCRAIAEGNAAKAMPVWKNFMPVEDIHALAAYVASMHGSGNGAGKAAEGVRQPITY